MTPDELDNLPPPPPTLNDLPSIPPPPLGDFDRPPSYAEIYSNELPPSYTVEESARKRLVCLHFLFTFLFTFFVYLFLFTFFRLYPDHCTNLTFAAAGQPPR